MQNINDLLQNQHQDPEGEQTSYGAGQDEEEQILENPTDDQDLENLSDVEIHEEITPSGDSESDEEVGEASALPQEEPLTESETESESEIPASKFVVIKDIIDNIKNELSKVSELLAGSVSEKDLEEVTKKLVTTKDSKAKEKTGQMRIVEGVFDGQNMIGGDGEHYTVPANYASKSKLVEGDLLKLTILQDGSFVYKQIAPIERRRIVGALAYDEAGEQYYVLAEGKRWKVLRASITYFKGEPGDEITIVIPKETPSQWAAVENIVKK